ncbi:MAG: glycoside hydrolase family 3 C-terminal domain-containing protein [Lachnospiraceae bacterium]|nr:glycoside hydrolase family 3 C-terminal domain-containing protein [Lachnospiraceae bacterium]
MKKGLMRGLAGITASLCAISLVATAYTPSREAFINTRLGTSSVELVETGDGSADPYYYESEFASLGDLVQANVDLSEQISAEGSVLLKNTNNALPIDTASETVTLWGHNCIFPAKGGMIGSSAAAAEGQDDPGFVGGLAARGFNINMDMVDFYASEEAFAYTRQTFFPGAGLLPAFTPAYEPPQFYMTGEIPASMYTDDILKKADGTAAIVIITRDSSEAADYSPTMFCATEGDAFERPLALSQYERDMIALAKQHSTKVIVLVNADNPMELKELKEDAEIDSILWVGAPGEYGFYGIADVLSGAANPSGRLPDTYATNGTSSPAMMNFGLYMYTNNTNNGSAQGDIPQLTEADKADWYLVENESIYNGYKYYETRYEDQILGRANATATEGSSTGSAWNYEDEVDYPFGYGLSYTVFSSTLDSVDLTLGEVGTATVTVKNEGDVAGKHAVELFVQAPYTEGGIEKSAIQLVGFGKTQILEPGQSETITIDVDPALFASYDETAVKADGTQGAWVLEAGDYYFSIGSDVHAALNDILSVKDASTVEKLQTINDTYLAAEHVQVWNLAETDIETYSVNVQNALQEANINNLIPDTVEYTTRTDWTKGWKTVDTLTPTADMMVGLTNSNYTLNANGEGVTWGADNGLTFLQMLDIDGDGNIVGVTDLADPKWDQLVQQITLDEAIQFIECGGDDLENLDSVMMPRTYVNDGPIGFAFDQVAGYKTRWTAADSARPTYVSDQPEAGYSMAVFPTEPIVAATLNKELVTREGELLGEEALYAKQSGIIAPGVNLHRTPYCARNHEYYSEDSVLVAIMANTVSAAMKSKGLMAQCKHFAFNHQELNRSGLSTFLTEQAGRENELRGFQLAMSSNNTASIMTAFNRVGTVFAGAHSGILEQIARNEWGFKGGIITDMVNGADYMNWRDTVAAGGGVMLSNTPTYLNTNIGTMTDAKEIIATDTFFQQKMQDSLKSWLYSVAQSNAANGLTETTVIKHVTPWWLQALYAADAVFAALTLLFVFLGLKSKKKEA